MPVLTPKRKPPQAWNSSSRIDRDVGPSDSVHARAATPTSARGGVRRSADILAPASHAEPEIFAVDSITPLRKRPASASYMHQDTTPGSRQTDLRRARKCVEGAHLGEVHPILDAEEEQWRPARRMVPDPVRTYTDLYELQAMRGKRKKQPAREGVAGQTSKVGQGFVNRRSSINCDATKPKENVEYLRPNCRVWTRQSHLLSDISRRNPILPDQPGVKPAKNSVPAQFHPTRRQFPETRSREHGGDMQSLYDRADKMEPPSSPMRKAGTPVKDCTRAAPVLGSFVRGPEEEAARPSKAIRPSSNPIHKLDRNPESIGVLEYRFSGGICPNEYRLESKADNQTIERTVIVPVLRNEATADALQSYRLNRARDRNTSQVLSA
eukprot:CAMPEP_0170148188 /NCGR_PEP_ID=MMETSP0033_2-20121228/37810_1 /TAXON_ID=195969 /ORGANISM="Dolichomastix tenuilepis, Strain CCMP3274" /LENGTH=380 /DNA_ID=CAMNT_0010385053 /DNA_START=30 /DNA_END=1168 /DNA_ORIENTATION=+